VAEARVIQVIEVKSPCGRGTEDDPNRIVTQLFSFDGKLIAEEDPCGPKAPEYPWAHNGVEGA
jgi:hypothetical protein